MREKDELRVKAMDDSYVSFEHDDEQTEKLECDQIGYTKGSMKKWAIGRM